MNFGSTTFRAFLLAAVVVYYAVRGPESRPRPKLADRRTTPER